MFYPHQMFPLAVPLTPPRAPVTGQQPPATAPAQLQERAGQAANSQKAEHCDGTDQLGCYQVWDGLGVVWIRGGRYDVWKSGRHRQQV